MQVMLTENQLNKIIKALEEKPEEVNDKFSVLNYLKIVRRVEFQLQETELDDVPFWSEVVASPPLATPRQQCDRRARGMETKAADLESRSRSGEGLQIVTGKCETYKFRCNTEYDFAGVPASPFFKSEC